MIKSLSRPAALVLSGSAVLLASAALPAQAASLPGWRVSATYPVRNGIAIFTSADAVSARDAWAAGLRGTNDGTIQTRIRHWNGKAWDGVSLPSKIARAWAKNAPLGGQIGASSSRDVWLMGGRNGMYLRLSGTSRTIGRMPGANLAKARQSKSARSRCSASPTCGPSVSP